MDRHTQADIVGILEGVPLFASLNKRQLKAVASVCSEIRFEPGRAILKELEPGQHLVVITAGTATVQRGKTTIATVGPGDVVGEMSLIDDEPRSATVRADSEVDGIAIYRTAFRRLLEEHPSMASKLLQAQTARLRESDKRAAVNG
jgi:CRP/FNR family transcriptional regulator, cyclic AMP receptor protein